MAFIRTKLTTGWPHHQNNLIKRIAWSILNKLSSNPDYETKLPLVVEWLIEFDNDELPWREIGLNARGELILAGPDDRNCGFWLDTNMTEKDFTGEPISETEFESYWQTSPAKDAKIHNC